MITTAVSSLPMNSAPFPNSPPILSEFVENAKWLEFQGICGILICAFSPRATLQQKNEFIFKVYDTDCNGKVSFHDMLRALRDLSGPFMSEQQREVLDLPTAASVIGSGTDTDWIQKANIALNKLSASTEEKIEVTFNSSLDSLILSVAGNDVESSQLAFVSSASAFEKWTSLTGLIVQLKGH